MRGSIGPVRIITVSREYGSGGGEIARMVGDALGWRVIDHAVIEEVSRRLHAPEAEIEAMDEHVGGIVERIAGVFARGSPEAPVVSPIPDPDTIAALARAVLRDALSSLPFVVVGHGGQCLFAGREDAIHVRVVAPLKARIRRVAERRGIAPEAAAREVEHRVDEERRYLKHHYSCDPDDPALYTIGLNTGTISLEHARTLIVQLVEWREPAPAANGG
jgi:cytidylate kinase